MRTLTAIATGLFLITAGGLLLAEQFDLLAEVRWRALLAVGLIMFGAVVLWGGRPNDRDRLPGR